MKKIIIGFSRLGLVISLSTLLVACSDSEPFASASEIKESIESKIKYQRAEIDILARNPNQKKYLLRNIPENIKEVVVNSCEDEESKAGNSYYTCKIRMTYTLSGEQKIKESSIKFGRNNHGNTFLEEFDFSIL